MPADRDLISAGGRAGRYGVLGRSLPHTYSPAIYRALEGLDYRVYEKEPDELEAFVRDGGWSGMNVTIPYKRAVVPLMDELAPAARRLGNVNTIVRCADGTLVGDNTDCYGFRVLVESLGADLAGREALVLGGTGGAGTTCMAVLEDLGARPVAVSRKGPVSYADLPAHAGAALVVNATPVGMYPKCPASPVDLELFDDLAGVVDVVYNPARTGLLMQAERLGVPASGGLLMLVAQAAGSIRDYLGREVDPARVRSFTEELSASEQNVVLIGMPGAGKTRVGEALAAQCGRAFVDIDRLVEAECGRSCRQVIEERGEDAFRALETACLARAARGSGQVVSCGGGVVERPENYELLHQNGRICMLDRPLQELSGAGRPLTERHGVEALAKRRMPIYRAWADAVVRSRETPALTAEAVRYALPGCERIDL